MQGSASLPQLAPAPAAPAVPGKKKAAKGFLPPLVTSFGDLTAQTPVWKDGVSKSMRRALSSSAPTLVRPSVMLAPAAKERALELRARRRAGYGNQPLKPEGWGKPGLAWRFSGFFGIFRDFSGIFGNFREFSGFFWIFGHFAVFFCAPGFFLGAFIR